MKYRLGLKEVQEQPRLQLCNYLRPSDLPNVRDLPDTFGHAGLIDPNWGVMLNQVIGDCAIAGSAHETMVFAKEGGKSVSFSDRTIVANYSAITQYRQGPEIEGFDDSGNAIINSDAPQNPTDQGTDVAELYDYRQSVGLLDDDGNHHILAGHAGLTVGNTDELLIALWLFGGVVGCGYKLPASAEQQFEEGQPWHLTRGRQQITGGHYVPIVGRASATSLIGVTWGKEVEIEFTWHHPLNTVAVVGFDKEMLVNGKTPDGVEAEKLATDLGLLNTGPVLTKAPKGKRAKDAEAA